LEHAKKDKKTKGLGQQVSSFDGLEFQGAVWESGEQQAEIRKLD